MMSRARLGRYGTIGFYLCLVAIGVLAFWSADEEAEAFRMGMQAAKSQDYATAITLWEPIAIKGHANAQFNLGILHARGLGTDRNLQTAANWYRLAAGQQLADAQVNLGLMLIQGRGVAKNPAEAASWLRKAAEAGNLSGKTNLGNLYLLGLGVKQDPAEAKFWLMQAAEEGHPLAQVSLARQLLGGSPTRDDMIAAYGWLAQVAAGPSSYQSQAVSLLNQLRSQMNDQEIDHATRHPSAPSRSR